MGKRIAVVGVGNILMADEGAGVKVLEELENRGLSGEVDLIDAGTGFFSIVPELLPYGKLIIVDTVKGGKTPGAVYRFELRDIEDDVGFLSVHDIGVLHSLKMYGMVQRIPDDIVLFGVEPYSVRLSLEITPMLKPVIHRLADLIIEEIKKDQQTRRKGNGSQYSKAGQRAHRSAG